MISVSLDPHQFFIYSDNKTSLLQKAKINKHISFLKEVLVTLPKIRLSNWGLISKENSAMALTLNSAVYVYTFLLPKSDMLGLCTHINK
jgi:hypothetical protein